MISERILQKNLRALVKNGYAEIARKIEQASTPPGWHVFEAKNGMPTLEIEYQGKKLSVHSRYDPQKEAKKWAASLEGDWEQLVLFGVGLGYHLEALKERYPQRKVIVVENSYNHIYNALAIRDLSQVISWLEQIVISSEISMVSRILINLTIGKKGNDTIQFRSLPAYEGIFGDYWGQVQKTLRDSLLLYGANFNLSLKGKYQWMLNLRENLIDYLEAPDLGQLFGKFAGLPVIVVASGPSLDKNIHLLKEAKGKAVILAAGSAIGPLLHHGVLPDLAVSMDPFDANYKHFANITETRVPLAFTITLNHQIVKNYPGALLSYSLDYYRSFTSDFEKALNREKSMLISAPSIAIPTIDFAVKLGGNPVILIGQDLAFLEGKSHATGNVLGKTVDEKGLFTVKGVHGTVLTNRTFLSMKVTIERIISGFADSVQFIDATEGGALIEGTKVSTLREVIRDYCQVDHPIKETIERTLNSAGKLSPDEQALLVGELESLLDDIRLFYEGQTIVGELAKRLSDGLQRGTLKENTYQRINKQMIKAFNRFRRTHLFKAYVTPTLKEELELAIKNAKDKVSHSPDFAEKVQNAADGYQMLFYHMFPLIKFLEEEIFLLLVEQLQNGSFFEIRNPS